MELQQLWQNNREVVETKHVRQIIGFFGQGKLQDESETSQEFREFLKQVPSEILRRYADECLTSKFDDSGFTLQDVVNQVGQRLGFQVEYGRYRGTISDVGHDGLWRFPDGHNVVVEVKTTDKFASVSRIANYRKKLIVSKAVDEDRSSILIVVGREDTGDLEAQIRGSRHAWDIRLISVDALLRLLSLKEAVDDPKTIQRICAILIPREFTRVDEIIDVVFSAAEEAKSEETLVEVDDEIEYVENQLPQATRPESFHDTCIEFFSLNKKIILTKRSRTTYMSPDNNIKVVCLVSKAHVRQNNIWYWFGFHPHQKEFLESSLECFLVLGCESKSRVLVIPFADLKKWLDDLWTTELDDRMYWHIRLQQQGTKLLLNRRKGIGVLDITPYLLSAQDAR
jgi:hypothetical protein